jgi:hypothetical protein
VQQGRGGGGPGEGHETTRQAGHGRCFCIAACSGCCVPSEVCISSDAALSDEVLPVFQTQLAPLPPTSEQLEDLYKKFFKHQAPYELKKAVDPRVSE